MQNKPVRMRTKRGIGAWLISCVRWTSYFVKKLDLSQKEPVSVGISVNTIGLSPIVTVNISRTHVSISRHFCELFLRIKEKKKDIEMCVFIGYKQL